jgi:hypothetical protein
MWQRSAEIGIAYDGETDAKTDGVAVKRRSPSLSAVSLACDWFDFTGSTNFFHEAASSSATPPPSSTAGPTSASQDED